MPHAASTPTRRFQCRHIFTDGRRCGSPCLRNATAQENFCYYHHTTRGAAARAAHLRETAAARRPSRQPGQPSRPGHSTFLLPLPEDRSAIQHAIGQVLQRIASNTLDPRRAGLLLYGLQIASLNLKQVKQDNKNATPEDTVAEITLDPIDGPLAPPAEVGHTKKPSTAAQLLEELLREEEERKLRQQDLLRQQAEALPRQPEPAGVDAEPRDAGSRRPPNHPGHPNPPGRRQHPGRRDHPGRRRPSPLSPKEKARCPTSRF